MRDIIFLELRECNRMIEQSYEAEEKESGNKKLIEIVEKMCELDLLSRKEGLLALQDVIYNLDDTFNGKYLKVMITLVVDGTDPELVEEYCTAKYFSSNLSGYEALHYLVMMFGILSIQAGEHPIFMEEKLLSLIPDEVADMYRQKQNEVEESETISDVDRNDILEKYYNGGIAATPSDNYYFQIKVTDYAFKSLDDRNIQRVLREVANSDLSLAMKGLSGEARHRIFDNLSSRIAVMLAEDMDFMGPVRMRDVANANIKIFSIIILLIDCGEITCADGEALCLFSKLFDASEDDAKNQKIEEAESDLYRLMKEYNSSSHRTINAPWENS